MKKVLYFIYIVILIILITFSSCLIYHFYNLKEENVSIKHLSVNEKSYLNYNLLLNDSTLNNDINNIDKINIKYDYEFNFSNKVEGQISYYVLILYNNEELYRTDKITNKINNKKTINISSSEILNMNNYKYESGNLIYKVLINYNYYDSIINKSFNEDRILELNVDYTNNIINKSNNINNKYKYYEDNPTNNNKLYLFIIVELGICIIIYTLVIIYIIKLLYPSKSKYDIILNRIFKKYSKYIININELPNLSNYDIVFVNKFEDLLYGSDKLKKDIYFINIINHKESVFMIIGSSKAYVYKLSEWSMINEKNNG